MSSLMFVSFLGLLSRFLMPDLVNLYNSGDSAVDMGKTVGPDWLL